MKLEDLNLYKIISNKIETTLYKINKLLELNKKT